jgi:hypothetical protein
MRKPVVREPFLKKEDRPSHAAGRSTIGTRPAFLDGAENRGRCSFEDETFVSRVRKTQRHSFVRALFSRTIRVIRGG